MKRVFLGGTCNNSSWRDIVISLLEDNGIDYFNPVVEHWDDEAKKRELHERETCDFCLYVITPKMMGVYSIAEVVDDSNKRPEKTIFCFIESDGREEFSNSQIKSLKAVGSMVIRNGGKFTRRLLDIPDLIN